MLVDQLVDGEKIFDGDNKQSLGRDKVNELRFDLRKSPQINLKITPLRKPGTVIISKVLIATDTVTRKIPLEKIRAVANIDSLRLSPDGLVVHSSKERDQDGNRPTLAAEVDFDSQAGIRSFLYYFVLGIILFGGGTSVIAFSFYLWHLLKAIEKQELITAVGNFRKWITVPLFLCGILGTLFTVHVISLSLEYGRLSQPSTYDDVVYLNDAAARVYASYMEEGGVLEYIINFFAEPPHGPLNTLLASAGFWLFGTGDWPPYVMNGIFVLFFLLVAMWLLRDCSLIARCFMGLALLSTNMLFGAVSEFRPDIPASLLAASGIALLISVAFQTGNRAGKFLQLLVSGFLLGLAVWAKPSASPLVIIIFAFVCLGVILLQLNQIRSWRLFLAVVQPLIIASVPLLIISVCWYLINYNHIFNYIYGGQFSEEIAEIYHEPLSGLQKWLFYVNGSGSIFLQQHFMVAAATSLLGGLFLVAGKAGRTREVLLLFATCVFWYVFVTQNPHKHAFFGTGFQSLLLLLPIVFTGWLGARLLSGSLRSWLLNLAILVFFLFSIAKQYTAKALWQFEYTHTDSRADQLAKLPEFIFHALDHTSYPEAQNTRNTVFVAYSGLVNDSTLKWEAQKRHKDIKFLSYPVHKTVDVEDVLEFAGVADYVFIPSGTEYALDPRFGTVAIAAEVIAALEESADWHIIARHPVGQGEYLLFRKN